MNDIPRHEGLEARIADAILPTLTHLGYELVRVQVSGKERPTVQVMADRADGAMFRVEDCEAISHAIGAVLDVADPIKGEWDLEVSSPGMSRLWNSRSRRMAASASGAWPWARMPMSRG
jgi:ribosome maturation factor RimP